MTTPARRAARQSRKLGVRLALMLSLALLPLGLISIYQTSKVTETLSSNARISLLARTEQSALGERRIVFSALGAAQALGAMIVEGEDPERCSARVRRFIDSAAGFVNAAFIPLDGIIRCHPGEGDVDVRENPTFQRQIRDPQLRVSSTDRGIISGQQVVAVTLPVFRAERLIGFATVSVPYARVVAASDGAAPEMPRATALFNSEGQIITLRTRGAGEAEALPEGLDLRDALNQGRRVFRGQNAEGAWRTFAIVPLLPGTLYVVSSWDDISGGATESRGTVATVAFPLAMWAASLVVGMFAVHRLVVRHVRQLGREMRAFARNRRISAAPRDPALSAELQAIRDEFIGMAENILQDEATLENALREKNELLQQTDVLMKEVHHRVKNNLQLISSIMNMQIRTSRDPETRALLQRLQDRIMGLATVHRHLYQAGSSGAVNAGQLVRDIARNTIAFGGGKGLSAQLDDIDDVVLFPDQAVPLSLLAAEALTNALKHIGGARPEVTLRLERLDRQTARIEVTNTVDDEGVADAEGGEGLGRHLIRAFAGQIGGTAETRVENGIYLLAMTFPVKAFDPADPDEVPPDVGAGRAAEPAGAATA